jgi:hypothetical protein
MTNTELREEIEIELDSLQTIVTELSQLDQDIGDHRPTLREKTAAGAFLAQFYTGIENILKRICTFYAMPLPEGTQWHITLFKYFCEPARPPLPILFDDDFATRLSSFRNFRHAFFHAYGFQLDWERMRPGIAEIERIFQRFHQILLSFLQSLP